MQIYRIEKRIKLPAPQHNSGGKTIGKAMATMLRLEVGDSFLVKDMTEAFTAQKSMRDCNRRERERKSKKQFASRRVKDGVRIWRIA